MTKSLLIVLVLALAACGGGGGSDGASTTSESELSSKKPTRKEYLARGDAICADTQAELARLQPRVDQARAASGEEQTRLLEEIWREQIRILDSFSSELKALGAPPGDEERVREFVRSLDEGERLGREITSHVENGEEPPESLINDYAQAAYRGNALARAYGFKVCGKESA